MNIGTSVALYYLVILNHFLIITDKIYFLQHLIIFYSIKTAFGDERKRTLIEDIKLIQQSTIGILNNIPIRDIRVSFVAFVLRAIRCI